MKKALVLLVLGLMMGVVGYGQNTFLRFYGAPNDSPVFNDCKRLANGSYACVGHTQSTITTNNRSFVVIYNNLGQIISDWSDSTAGRQTYTALVATPDSGFIAIGNWGGAKAIVKFNSLGDTVWTKNTPLNISQQVPGIAAISETLDSSYILSYPYTNGGNQDVYVAKIDSQGDTIWIYQWGSSLYNENPSDIISTSDGGYLLTGNYKENSSNFQYYTFAIKLNPNGTESWVRTYLDTLTLDILNTKVLEKASGGYILSSAYTKATNIRNSGLIVTIDANGNSISSNEFADYCRFYDISQTQDGGYLLTGYSGYTEYFFEDSIVLMKLDQDFNEVWRKYYKSNVDVNTSGSSVTAYQGNEMVVCGDWGGQAFILKTDSTGNIPFSIIKGMVLKDNNINCNKDSSDIALANHKVEVALQSSFYGYSNQNGEYLVTVYDTGQAVITLHPPNQYWTKPVCQPNGTIVSIPFNDTLNLDIFTETTIDCPLLTVNISTWRLRRCAQNRYLVNYCNNGTMPANSAYIEIEMDPYLTVDSASIPWVLPQQGNLYRFNVDTVGIGQCGSFNLWVTVDCDSTELGQTHCVSAHIYPDSICLPPDPAWDGSSVAVTGSCDVGDTLDLKIQNVGGSDMTSPSFFLIAEDNVMYQSGNFQLPSGDSLKFRFKGNGSTFTLIANQVEGHPGRSFPMVSIEGCGTNNQGTFSKGFVTQYPQDDQNGYVDILCLQNIGAYDPNDKRAEPQGLDTEGYITASQPLDYTIRFQNTGTDTAFTVVLRDTLSPNLDITTLYLTGASHPYTFQIIGSNVLEWTFPNILLPDSNTNEPLSHGFVSFGINQIDGNAPGTEITNRAGIYFDFNPPIITNTTLNTVIADYKTWFTFIQSPESKLQLGIYPNPNNGTFSLDFTTQATNNYEFVMYDLAGTKQFGQTLTGNAPYVMQPDLPTGMYIYQLLENGVAVNMGKVVVNR